MCSSRRSGVSGQQDARRYLSTLETLTSGLHPTAASVARAVYRQNYPLDANLSSARPGIGWGGIMLVLIRLRNTQ